MPPPDELGPALAEQTRQLDTLERLSLRFGQSLAGAMTSGVAGGKELAGVLDGVSGALAKALSGAAGSALGSGLQEATRALSASVLSGSFGPEVSPFARGGVLSGGAVVPFADGGVVAAPTYFPLGRSLGLIGEAGAEAIMPLGRGPDGRLGVRSAADASSPAITVNIAATDIDSFRRSEAQVAAALARAVARGRRAS